jgi:HK97 family phage major capsid protein
MGALAQRHGLQYLQRDLNVATPGAGGYLTQTTNMGFDELLRNISFAFRMGVTRLSGLRDNIAIPRQSAAATAEWLTSETDTAAESQQTFTQLLMSPKTVSAYTELSRQLLLQSTQDVEGLVNADLAAVSALAVDAAVLNGSGASGQPEGLDNVTGVGSVSGTSLGFAGILECQTDVATANVMPISGGYVTTPNVASLMIQRVKYSGTASPLWEGNIWNGMMQGFAAMSTNQVAAATMYFGDWAKAIVAEWGVLEVETNPFANFPAGIIGVRAMYSVDVGIRYPAAFTKVGTIT